MKNRSNRLPSAGAPDDWVNDSWTVDCVCGVNFDDGEEMVDCDECGVWVHTRCSRFVKGEKSFACDKCKSKNSRNGSEETEVAQLLVELPNKTIKMKNSHPLGNPPHRPYKHWTERPIEERVHVQGLPGGDPSLFQGLSSIFSPQLWKCTGYVPKKFDFHYREFPCWNEEQNVPVKVGEDSENLVDKGAGVLYSLSKEIAVSATAEALAGMRGQFSNGRHEKKPSKERKGEGSDVKNIGTQSIMKKERSLLRPFILSCGKRRREDMGTSKDQSGKKRPKALEREHDAERKKTHALKTVVTHPTNGRQVEVYERKAQKVLRADDLKHGNGKDTGSQEVATVAHLAAGSNIEKPKRSVAVDESNLEAASSIMLDHYYSSEKVVKTEKSGRSTSKTPFLPPLMEKDDAGSTLMNEEGVNLNNLERKHGIQFGSLMAGLQKSKDIVEDAVSTAPDVKDVPLVTDTGIDVLMGSLHSDMKAEAGTDVGNHEAVTNSCSKYIDVKVNPSKDLVLEPVLSNNKMAEIYSAANSESSEHKALYVDKGLEAVSDRCSGKADQISENPCTGKPGSVESECPTGTEKSRLDTREVSRVPMETSKLSGGSPSGSLSQWKMVSNGKTSPSSSTILISRSASDKCRTSNSQDSIGKHVTSNSSIHKENTTREPLGNENKYELTRSMNKERAKSSVKPVFKVSQRNMTSQSSVSKHSSLDAGEPSYKASSVESSVHAPIVGETPGSLQVQGASHGQHKRTASGAQQRGEKAVLSNAQSSSKAAQSSSGHLPASSTPAGLSDEELALLLHQELNSSPRVPRVPRVRHAGSLPQLSSASATSMLIKHSSSTGGKDQYSFSRRKSKDVHKDGSHSSREHDSEVRKGDRGPSSPDSAKTADALMHVEANRESLQSARKCTPQASASAANSGPSSSTDANEQDFSTLPRSPVNNSEDDAGTSKVPAHRTLPELIAEIMSKGKRMTYEELCNAVLPHWRNLRKHNGERYAYSSPSQAVLDCLRNRTEWAQLVDRGPKTSASRKRRKIDAETHSAESEEGEERAMKEDEGKSLDSNREEFPKGKRKARKRGRLALQGRGIKDVRSRRKTEVSSSDDGGSSSNSSEESACSDDESQGDGTTGTGSEASASSDEAADML